MTNRIILVTRRFPYFKTEAFLEAEIEFLAKEFEEVLIIPSEIGNEVRSVPINVKVDTSFSEIFQNRKIRALKTIFSLFFWKTLWLYKEKINGLKSIKHIFQFCSSVIVYSSFFSKFQFSKNDLFYTYWLTEATKAIVDFKKKRDLFIISRAHRYDIYEGLASTPSFWPYREDVLRSINCVYSISENGKQYLEDKYQIFNKVRVSKLGVFDREKISPELDEDRVFIVSVSRIDPMKRVDLIAESIVEFARRNPHKKIDWRHFGEGKDRLKIKSSIEEFSNLKVELNGAVANKEIYEFYEKTAISIFMNLSSSEGIPVSIMEAQSFGIPVIATDVGGSGEIVQGNVGRLISADPSVEEVLDAINDILNRRLGRNEIKSNWLLNFNATTNYNSFVKEIKILSLK